MGAVLIEVQIAESLVDGRSVLKSPLSREFLRPLILRRPLDVVDDEEVYGSVGGFEFQA